MARQECKGKKMRGLFITFEGIDGSGKTTQINALEKWIRSRGIDLQRTREPGGTPLGEKIRSLLLADDMTPLTETLLFFAGRSEHIARVIEPALRQGRWVLSDRFTDATYAYQVGGKGLHPTVVEDLELLVQNGLQPDKTFLFDVSPEVAAQRLARARAADRFEKESEEFFRRVRNAYLDRARRNPQRFVILNAEEDPAEVTHKMLLEAASWL